MAKLTKHHYTQEQIENMLEEANEAGMTEGERVGRQKGLEEANERDDVNRVRVFCNCIEKVQLPPGLLIHGAFVDLDQGHKVQYEITVAELKACAAVIKRLIPLL